MLELGKDLQGKVEGHHAEDIAMHFSYADPGAVIEDDEPGYPIVAVSPRRLDDAGKEGVTCPPEETDFVEFEVLFAAFYHMKKACPGLL